MLEIILAAGSQIIVANIAAAAVKQTFYLFAYLTGLRVYFVNSSKQIS